MLLMSVGKERVIPKDEVIFLEVGILTKMK